MLTVINEGDRMKTLLRFRMRAIALVLFAITLLGLSAKGQNRQDILSEELLKSTKTSLFTKDSSYTYRWNNNSSSWEGLWKKQYSYNSDNNIAEIIYYIFDTNKSSWDAKWKELYTYDDIENLLTECEFQEFNSSTNEWVPSQLFSYQYSVRTLLSCLVETWDPQTAQWANWRFDSFIYDLNGRKKEYQVEYWDNISNNWSNSMKTTPVYNNSGKIETELCESWIVDNWQNLSSETTTYNSKGLKSIMTTSVWDGSWNDQDRFTYLYDNNNQLSEMTHMIWNKVGSAWNNSNKILYQYDENGNALQEVHQKFNSSTSGWDLTMRQNSYWSKNSIETDILDPDNNSISLYPNPAVNELYLTGVETNTVVAIYDMSGKLVKTINNYFAGSPIDVSDIGVGVYVIKAQSKVAQFVKK